MKRLSILFLIFTLFACNNRDKIDFVDTNETVSSSMKVVILMLEKTSNGEMMNFFIDKEIFFYVNNNKVARIQNMVSADLLPYFNEGVSQGEIDSFLINFKLLIRNEITSIYFDKYYNQYFFTYKRSSENTIDQLRLLAFNVDFKNFSNGFKILDKQGDLYLLAPIRIE